MHRRCLALSAALVALAALAPAAGADGAPANCSGALAEVGGTWAGSCTMPYQGHPIGVAAVYDSNPADLPDPQITAAGIHVEILAKFANGLQRAMGIECDEITTDVARCRLESNPLGTPAASPEPVPTDIVSLTCEAHSHVRWTKFAPPAGAFACWSTDHARDDLTAQGWFARNGFPAGPAPEPEPEPQPGPLGPLAGVGLSSTVTTVPFNTYAPDTLVVSRSLGLRYLNADTARHDVVAREARRPDGSAPWCKDFDAGTCPLFWTPLVAGGGSEAPVQGLEDAEVGRTYTFYCTIHPYMVGTLRVVE